MIDIGLLFAAWLASGVAFYYYCDEDWSLDYAIFFAINAGLGVGYGDYVPDRPVTKVFTVAFSVVGTSLIMGGLGIFFEMLTQHQDQLHFGLNIAVGIWAMRLKYLNKKANSWLCTKNPPVRS